MLSRTFIAKNQHHISGFKTRKDKITLLCCCNVAGHIIKPGLIYKAAKPRAIKHCDEKSLHVHWMHNKKAWTTRNLFLYWFHRCFITETKRYLSALDLEFKVLLILDNATGHPQNLQFASEDVDVAFLSPNTSSLIQLLSQWVIRTFKAYYTRSFMARLVAAMDEDSHLEVIDYWKNSALQIFCALLRKSDAEAVNSCWRNLWPDCVKTKSTFLAADEEPHAVNMTVALAHLVDGSGFKDLQELEVIELIESHTSKLTDELLVEITGSTDEESDADEDSATDETEELTLEGVAEIPHTLKQRDVEIAADPYQRIVDEIKKRKKQLSIAIDSGRRGGEAELITNHVAVALGYRSIFGLEDQWRSTVVRRRNVASHWCAVLVGDRSCCDLLRWLLIARCNKQLKRLSGVCFVDQSGQMSSSKRIGGRKVNPDGDVPDTNNKAETDPPTVTANLNLFQYPISFVRVLLFRM
ncbi:Tigger transposable element-derived protein 1 [Trichinella zimbabwensis]|uniref:Tigger transposable element-derived protein 1 n=1 Tax=Trichinella zimbabwensis TaxID=268475 RepID=A0A0V1HLV9_9BILA|nr:Tigger transposable element-derived protein 1 [Trichinella zimbabwensis]